MDFRNYLKEKFKDEKIIEFGPLTRPLFNKDESKNISYADIRSTEEIKQLYSDNDYLKKTGIRVDIDEIVNVDYKIDGSYANTFKGKKFSVAYLSHVIEHMPDIIHFFNEINEILEDEGRLVIIYPDKRYCFDHYRNSVSFRDAYATYKYGIKENARIAFDFGYNVVHENDAAFFWNGTNLINVISKNKLEDAEKYYEETLTGEIADGDVHFWPFSDIDFLKFVYEMKRADLFDYEIEEFYPTEENTQEFMIILKKSSNKECGSILGLINQYDTQTKENNYKNKIQEKDIKIEELKSNIEYMQNNNNKQAKEIEQQAQELRKKEKKIEVQIKELAEKNKQIELQEQQIELNNEKIKILEHNKSLLDQRVEELNNVIKKYEESKSWKLTRPIRKITNKIKKVIKDDKKSI